MTNEKGIFDRNAAMAFQTTTDLSMDWEDLFGSNTTASVHTESISDALIHSLANRACVDVPYICEITGEDVSNVIAVLEGAIYQNPETWNGREECGWETAEEYLSGNLYRKWKAAQKANAEYPGKFARNEKALMEAMPDTVDAKGIYVTLGSPWVPTDVIDEFITYLLCPRYTYSETLHDEVTGTWELPHKNDHRFHGRVASNHTYGIPELEAMHILERTLNMKTVSVTEEVSSLLTKSGTKRVINKERTAAALERQRRIVDAFRKWVWKDEARRTRLETIFDERYGCVRKRSFNGEFLTFPTMSDAITLYPYQKNAVARILFSPNVLLAHDVGSGKTYVMIAAGMESRRIGLSKKNLYVVPNNIVGQWKEIFLSMYPHASILAVDPKSFVPQKRGSVLRAIRDKEFDAIIMAYSCFDQISLSKESYLEELRQKTEELERAGASPKRITAGLSRQRETLRKEIEELMERPRDNEGSIFFDDLGIDRLFLDEAHSYKNLPIQTQTTRVLGISATGSKKCRDMYDKVRFIQKGHNGGGVVFATGTPITNSITDAFVIQKYLQGGELAMLDLQSFDAWIGMFAERETAFEIDVDTSGYRLATRFSRFHNLPELTTLLSSVADFHHTQKDAELPEFDGYEDVLIPRTERFKDYLLSISERAETVRAGKISRTDDNMLKITTDGRKAALDLRLVDPKAGFVRESKVAACAAKVFSIYRRHDGAQLIFCDTSTPKEGFNVYDEIKELLVLKGVPAEEIAYVHDATTEKQRDALFARVRRGEIRVLIGSTFKLGIGVNVQDKLVALHDVDIPWRPADATQRLGRLLRPGNTNDRVYAYRYITEGSFDAYSWQLLETKQRFISELLSGSLDARSGSDIENTVLEYAEVKALAIGNPLIKKRVETANELARLYTLQKQAIDAHVGLERELEEYPSRIAQQKLLIERCTADTERVAGYPSLQDKEERRALRHNLFAAAREHLYAAEETEFTVYRSFRILLPANMDEKKTYVTLAGEGRYQVELGESEVGSLIRIDNFLDALPLYAERLRENLALLMTREREIRAELSKKENFTDRIAKLQEKLANLDKKLGVKS